MHETRTLVGDPPLDLEERGASKSGFSEVHMEGAEDTPNFFTVAVLSWSLEFGVSSDHGILKVCVLLLFQLREG